MKGLLISARTATGAELTSLVTQYNTLRSQVDFLATDANYQGINLVNGTGQALTVSFSTNTSSLLSIASVDLRVATSGLSVTSAANFSIATNIDAAAAEIEAAIGTLRGQAQTLASNIAILQTRLDFNTIYVNLQEEGAGKLNLADLTEEGASLVALQTRQALGINSLAIAGQSEQSILQLFR